MTLCPIAIAVGCKKCPAFSVCPLKGVIGDYTKDDQGKRGAPAKSKSGAKSPKR
jgi:hypothetical protein